MSIVIGGVIKRYDLILCVCVCVFFIEKKKWKSHHWPPCWLRSHCSAEGPCCPGQRLGDNIRLEHDSHPPLGSCVCLALNKQTYVDSRSIRWAFKAWSSVSTSQLLLLLLTRRQCSPFTSGEICVSLCERWRYRLQDASHFWHGRENGSLHTGHS